MWVDKIEQLNLNITSQDEIYTWLTQTTALTAAMRAMCNNLELKVLEQNLNAAHHSEQKLLNISENNSLIREICIYGDDNAWIYGRVVIPHVLYKKLKYELDNLHNKPIGETLLYNRAHVQRSAFYYAELDINNWLHAKIKKHFVDINQPILLARSSIFTVEMCPLIITEVFLPELCTYPNQ